MVFHVLRLEQFLNKLNKDNFSFYLLQFLERTPQLRLGYQKGCFPSPMHEPFFSDVEWGKIFNKELNPPFVPLLQSVVSQKLKGNFHD